MANSINSPYYLDPADTGRGSAGALNSGLPVISEGLDSVRAYQFEMHFELPSIVPDPNGKLTLAAKQVTAAGFTTEDIEVNRVNDKVFYPGKASITFISLRLLTRFGLGSLRSTIPLTVNFIPRCREAAHSKPQLMVGKLKELPSFTWMLKANL